MNNSLELVYESIYQRKPINESFMGFSGKPLHELFARAKQIIHTTYGDDIMDIIASDIKLDDVKRALFDLIKNSDVEDLLKVKLINKLGRASDICSLYNTVLANGRAY